jgi:hypothetical protein
LYEGLLKWSLMFSVVLFYSLFRNVPSSGAESKGFFPFPSFPGWYKLSTKEGVSGDFHGQDISDRSRQFARIHAYETSIRWQRTQNLFGFVAKTRNKNAKRFGTCGSDARRRIIIVPRSHSTG